MLTPNMTLELSLGPSLFMRRFMQAQKDEPRRDTHWVGQKRESEQGRQEQGGRKDDKPQQGDSRGYRDLASIKLGEVKEAFTFFENQLIASPHEAWVATNQFCMLDLSQKNEKHPPAIFGQVRASFPSDGYIQNIQEMELAFPQNGRAADIVHVRAKDMLLPPRGRTQSYSIRVKFLASEEDAADFDQYENIFLEKGFKPEFSAGYIDLLDLNELNKDSYPWLFVVGSRWFASIPDSIRLEVKSALQNLIRWNKLVFNYHPKGLSSEIKTLNDELDFNYGFTEHYLIRPQDAQQTVHILAAAFEERFVQCVK